jgi:hypothetical protein
VFVANTIANREQRSAKSQDKLDAPEQGGSCKGTKLGSPASPGSTTFCLYGCSHDPALVILLQNSQRSTSTNTCNRITIFQSLSLSVNNEIESSIILGCFFTNHILMSRRVMSFPAPNREQLKAAQVLHFTNIVGLGIPLVSPAFTGEGVNRVDPSVGAIISRSGAPSASC